MDKLASISPQMAASLAEEPDRRLFGLFPARNAQHEVVLERLRCCRDHLQRRPAAGQRAQPWQRRAGMSGGLKWARRALGAYERCGNRKRRRRRRQQDLVHTSRTNLSDAKTVRSA